QFQEAARHPPGRNGPMAMTDQGYGPNCGVARLGSGVITLTFSASRQTTMKTTSTTIRLASLTAEITRVDSDFSSFQPCGSHVDGSSATGNWLISLPSSIATASATVHHDSGMSVPSVTADWQEREAPGR